MTDIDPAAFTPPQPPVLDVVDQPSAPTPPAPPPPPAPTPAPQPEPDPLAGLPSFNFRVLGDEEDPEVPFAFQGQKYTLHPARINALVAGDLPGMKVSMDSKPMWEFLEGILGDDYDRFRKVIRSPKVIIDAAEFTKMVEWMVAVSGGRPT